MIPLLFQQPQSPDSFEPRLPFYRFLTGFGGYYFLPTALPVPSSISDITVNLHQSVIYFLPRPAIHSRMASCATGENTGRISPFISDHSVLAG